MTWSCVPHPLHSHLRRPLQVTKNCSDVRILWYVFLKISITINQLGIHYKVCFILLMNYLNHC